MHTGQARRTRRRASFAEGLDDFAKSKLPRPHQGKWRPNRPAFLAKGRSDATEFENLNELDARKAGNEPTSRPRRGQAAQLDLRPNMSDMDIHLPCATNRRALRGIPSPTAPWAARHPHISSGDPSPRAQRWSLAVPDRPSALSPSLATSSALPRSFSPASLRPRHGEDERRLGGGLCAVPDSEGQHRSVWDMLANFRRCVRTC